MCNILVISSIPSTIALKKYSKYCTFYINLEKEQKQIKESEKIEKIKQLAINNNFTISDDELVEELAQLDSSELENTLTRAFVKGLNNNSNTLTRESVDFPKIDSSKVLSELNSLIGLENAKRTIVEIVNYLTVSKKRNDLPSLNMAFLGNPRNR